MSNYQTWIVESYFVIQSVIALFLVAGNTDKDKRIQGAAALVVNVALGILLYAGCHRA